MWSKNILSIHTLSILGSATTAAGAGVEDGKYLAALTSHRHSRHHRQWSFLLPVSIIQEFVTNWKYLHFPIWLLAGRGRARAATAAQHQCPGMLQIPPAATSNSHQAVMWLVWCYAMSRGIVTLNDNITVSTIAVCRGISIITSAYIVRLWTLTNWKLQRYDYR